MANGRVNKVVCHRASALILDQIASSVKATTAKAIGANFLAKCKRVDKRIESEKGLYDLLKVHPIEEKDIQMEIQKIMNQVRSLSPRVEPTSKVYALMFRLAAMPVTSSILKECKDVGPYLRSLRKDTARPNLAAISAIVLENWKLVIKNAGG